LSGGQLPHMLWHWHVDLLSQKERNKKQENYYSLF